MFFNNVLDDLFHIQWPLWLQGGLTKGMRICVYVCRCSDFLSVSNYKIAGDFTDISHSEKLHL